MKITLAKSSGFCFGVRRAVDSVFALANQDKKICTYGELIHNKSVTDILENQGFFVLDNIDDLPKDTTVVIRTHGVGKEIYDKLKKSDCDYIDMTCPFVLKIHKLVSDASDRGDIVIIIGDINHAEVKGIVGHIKGEKYVVKDLSELKDLLAEKNGFESDKVIIACQTTYNREDFLQILSFFQDNLYTNIKLFDTICNATDKRQQEAAHLSQHSDTMLVIGGANSSNTKKLYEICKKYCKNTFQIQNAKELDKSWFINAENVGVTAGASTPDFVIKEVLHYMVELKNGNEIINGEESFEQLLNENFKMVAAGQIVTGTIVAVTETEVQMDLGIKHSGYLSQDEIPSELAGDIQSNFKVGDDLTVQVLKLNDVEGTVSLSLKRLTAMKGWKEVLDAYESGEVLSGKIVAVVKGGVIAEYKGVNIFIPASQATLKRDDDLNKLVNAKADFKIIKAENDKRRRAVGSIKSVLNQAQKQAAKQLWDSIEVDKTYEGVVKSITNYGAFVDIGGVDGMVHISELSWNKIKHPSEVLSVGDKLNVYVKSIDRDLKRISLGYKDPQDDPFVKFTNQYKVDDVCEVCIERLMPYGAFAKICDGVDGLIHISQISNKKIQKPSDVLKQGDKVMAKIIEINEEAKQVNLSIKALIAEETAEEAAE